MNSHLNLLITFQIAVCSKNDGVQEYNLIRSYAARCESYKPSSYLKKDSL